MFRHPHNLSHTKTLTANMGLVYPSTIFEVFPGDSFRIQASNLTRFLPQVAPTMHDVFIGVDTYQVPFRQLFEKMGLNWDDFLTGGEDGMINVEIPTITIPDEGFDPGGLADFLGLPTNFTNTQTGEVYTGIGAGLKVSALPIIAYMHIINENYRDQNFVKKLDLTKYQEFLDGTYEFQDASGRPLEYDLLHNGLFPKAWSRDYFGRALPNTQRGPEATLPISGNLSLNPTLAPVKTVTTTQVQLNDGIEYSLFRNSRDNAFPAYGLVPTSQLPLVPSTGPGMWWYQHLGSNPTFYLGQTWTLSGAPKTIRVKTIVADSVTSGNVKITFEEDFSGLNIFADIFTVSLPGVIQTAGTYADLQSVEASLKDATAASIISFRLAARMQAFGETLQRAGARAVEFTLAMFGVRIPDERVQRPIFHGSFKLPVIFSEVLQTSSTDDTSPQGNLAGHGITGGTNKPIHIKVIEHGYIMSVMHIMPRSQFQNVLPKLYDRYNRFDLPNPIFQNVGEQPIKRKEIFPSSEHPEESFGYVPRYSELMHIPSTLHGHMKDTFLHWTMARLYTTEPVLSAAWRYEKPTDRSFSVKNEDQTQICIGYEIRARRPFARNPRPGISIV